MSAIWNGKIWKKLEMMHGKVIRVMKKELPLEAQDVEMFDIVLKRTEELIEEKRIKL